MLIWIMLLRLFWLLAMEAARHQRISRISRGEYSQALIELGTTAVQTDNFPYLVSDKYLDDILYLAGSATRRHASKMPLLWYHSDHLASLVLKRNFFGGNTIEVLPARRKRKSNEGQASCCTSQFVKQQPLYGEWSQAYEPNSYVTVPHFC
ncbi:hypothetical protein DFH29DRAFT_883938 [Suillus ampliporus]|nr:hypothetical protein DFH29DRAFT_883938 [Suillus ampliporus]